MESSLHLKNILSARFKRRGNNGVRSGIFEELDPEIINKIKNTVVFNTSELPIITSYTDEENWVLLTTERVVFNKMNIIHSVRNNDIKNVEVDLISENKRNVREIKNFKYLMISDSQSKYKIEVESGDFFIGFWNVLKILITK